MYKVEDIRKIFIDKLNNEDFVIDKTGVKTIEIVGANFIADEKTIFGELNLEYIRKEIKWYESKSLNVNDIEKPIPEIWQKVADKDGYINSNYGWCIWSNTNYNQYENVLIELLNNLYSRRAIMIYTRPNMWLDFDKNGRSDFMCTNAVQYLCRDNKLHCVVQMRSCDGFFGFRNDRAFQEYVLWQLGAELNKYGDLNVEIGDIIWQVGSLHFYERHFKHIK